MVSEVGFEPTPPFGDQNEWCAGMVPVPKKYGKVRICVDFTALNRNFCRERYILPTVDEFLAKQSFLQTRRQLWVLASPNENRISSPNNIYYSNTEILF